MMYYTKEAGIVKCSEAEENPSITCFMVAWSWLICISYGGIIALREGDKSDCIMRFIKL